MVNATFFFLVHSTVSFMSISHKRFVFCNSTNKWKDLPCDNFPGMLGNMQQKCILSHFWSPEVKIKVSAGLNSSGGSEEESAG